MNLPHASQDQMATMHRIAEQKMKKDGFVLEETPVEPLEQKHPMLAHHEEPSMQSESETTDLPESEEYEDSVDEIVQESPTETPQQMNFRMIKERAERAERERDEAMKYAMQFNQPKQQVAPAEPEDDYSDIGLDDDGLAEGKHLKKVLKEMRQLKKEMQEYKTKATNDTVEVKLKSQYPDFDKVITHDNLQALSSMNPDLADMISQTPDMYKRAKLAYDMVKQYGIYQDTPKAVNYDVEKALAQKNAAKPRPLASVSPQQGDSPLSKANAFANGSLSKDMKEQFRREMIDATRGR
jgi:hypothetical protein